MGTAFFGREAEVDRIRKMAADRERPVFVFGEPGVGKSRLLGELESMWRDENRGTIRVVGVSATSVPFAPFAHLLEPSDVPDQALTERLVRLRVAIRSRGAAGSVLVLDDGHALDAASVSLLHQLIIHDEIAVVLAARHEPLLADELSSMMASDLVDRVDLGPLSQEDTERVIASLVAGHSRELNEEVWRLSAGNPLFISELVLGDRSARDHAGTLASTATLPALSTRLRDVVGARLGQLSTREREFVDTLAVAGALSVDAAARLLSFDEIGALEMSHLVRFEHGHDAARVRLHHDLHREVALATSGDVVLHAARRRAIDALESAEPMAVADILLAARLRLHARLLDDTVMAAAAWIAFQHYDPALALEYAEAAISAGSHVDGPLCRSLALGALGEHDRATAGFVELARSADGPEVLTQVTLHHATHELMMRGDPLAAMKLLQVRLAEVGAEHDAPLRVMLSTVQFYIGQPAAAADTASGLLDAVPFPADVAVPLGSAWAILGQPDRTLQVFDRLINLLRTKGPDAVSPFVVVNVPFTRLLALWQTGALAEAEDPLSAFSGAAAHPMARSEVMALLPAAQDLFQGHLNRAAAAYEARRELIHIGPAQVVAMHGILLAMIHALRGDIGGTRRGLQIVQELPDAVRQGFRWWEARARWLLACAEGDVGGAIEDALRRSDEFADQLFHRTVSLHDVVRMGCADRVVDELEVAAARPGATWLDRACAAHARAATDRDVTALLEVSERFESGGLDLNALEAAALAAKYAPDVLLGVSVGERVDRLSARCGRVMTPAVLDVPRHLTLREVQVARLAASGLSNKEIAGRLGTSVRTVGNQLQRVYQKLGVRSREDLVTRL